MGGGRVAVYIWYDGVDANKSLPLIRAALVAPSCHVMWPDTFMTIYCISST